jgi:hypothetical protein
VSASWIYGEIRRKGRFVSRLVGRDAMEGVGSMFVNRVNRIRMQHVGPRVRGNATTTRDP